MSNLILEIGVSLVVAVAICAGTTRYILKDVAGTMTRRQFRYNVDLLYYVITGTALLTYSIDVAFTRFIYEAENKIFIWEKDAKMESGDFLKNTQNRIADARKEKEQLEKWQKSPKLKYFWAIVLVVLAPIGLGTRFAKVIAEKNGLTKDVEPMKNESTVNLKV